MRNYIFYPLIVLFFIYGCTSRTPAGSKITFFTWVPLEEERVNKSLIKEFETQNPGTKIEYINDPDRQAMQKLQVMFAGNESPDIMSIHGAYFLPFASRGFLLPLDEFIDKCRELKLSDFYPKLINGCKYRGTLYSLPRYTSVYVLFYNRNLFDGEGLTYPGENFTWDDFLNAAKRLTKDTNNDGVIDQFGSTMDFWGARIYPWIWQNNGRIFDTENNLCLLNDKNTVEAIQFLVDLRYRHKVVPLVLPVEYKSNVEMFRTGKIGMFISGAWDIQGLRSEKAIPWNIGPLPKNKKKATMLGMENYAISSRTKNKELSYKFLEFILGKESQLLMAEKLDKQPSLVEAGKIFAEGKRSYDRKVLTDTLEYGLLPPNLMKYSEIELVLQQELDLIWLKKKTVKEGLESATKKINAILKE